MARRCKSFFFFIVIWYALGTLSLVLTTKKASSHPWKPVFFFVSEVFCLHHQEWVSRLSHVEPFPSQNLYPSSGSFIRPQLLFLPFAMLREPCTGKILDKSVPCPISQVFACPARFIGWHLLHPVPFFHNGLVGYMAKNTQTALVAEISR